MSQPCARAVNFSKLIATHDRKLDREAYLERKLSSVWRKLKEERATRITIEQSLAALDAEIQRLKLLVSRGGCNTGAHERRKVLRALLLCFHPDKIGEDTMMSSTAVAQVITQHLDENDD
eukprot:1040238-Prymnesium_polylepis.1